MEQMREARLSEAIALQIAELILSGEIKSETKLRQEELAEKLDLSASYIGMIERGKKVPRLETFVEIANVLEVSADELLCGVVDHGYEIRMSEYTKRIGKISQEKRKLIYSLLDVCLSQEE